MLALLRLGSRTLEGHGMMNKPSRLSALITSCLLLSALGSVKSTRQTNDSDLEISRFVEYVPQNSTSYTACPEFCSADNLPSYPSPNSTTATQLTGEPPPPGFRVHAYFHPDSPSPRKHLGIFKVYTATLGAMVELALKDWNAPRKAYDYVKEIGLSIQVRGEDFQTKSVLWSLFFAVKFMEDQGEWAGMRFQTLVGQRMLGIGSYVSLVGAAEEGGGVGLGPGNATSATTAKDSVAPTSESEQTSTESTDLTVEPRIEIEYDWVRNGRVYTPGAIFLALYKLVVSAAEHDKHESVPAVIFYSREFDFTVLVKAMSHASIGNLKVKIILLTLRTLGTGLAGDRPGGRFQEMTGRIRANGRTVGQVLITKGRLIDPGQQEAGASVEAWRR